MIIKRTFLLDIPYRNMLYLVKMRDKKTINKGVELMVACGCWLIVPIRTDSVGRDK